MDSVVLVLLAISVLAVACSQFTLAFGKRIEVWAILQAIYLSVY